MAVVLLDHRFDGPGNAPTVLLLPSPGAKWSMWEPQMPELTRRLRVLRVNLRGHGGSPPPPRGTPTLADLGADLLDLLDAHGLRRLSVVGCGLGGMLATWVAAAAPDRVRRLAYVAAGATAPRSCDWRGRAARVRSAGMAAVSAEATAAWFTPLFAERRPDVVLRMAAEFEGVTADGYAAYCGAVAGVDQQRMLAAVRAPALVVSAAHDPLLPPAYGRRLAAGIPGARFRVVPGAAHLAGIERADRVNELLMGHVGG
ncbi:alpha/beta fold hydrolase [Nocardiopsis trehalosi]|jgi:3-oxoadipate enol-lactonase|uniref:alpha/beta fold hydrolase n=1 Tax=Nocardiopsis trehalosi TaxID=109329 RepID=UPI00082B6FAC|nr:alpha/beta fold hydrolase [Nocardiopsis trehalosi]